MIIAGGDVTPPALIESEIMAPRLISPAAATPVSLAEAKAHLRIDSADQDALIQTFIDSATAHLDGWTGILGRCMVAQTWAVFGADFADCSLPFPDIDASAVVVKYYDAANVQQTLDAANYRVYVDTDTPYLVYDSSSVAPEVYSRDDAITIEFVAGYGATSDVPAPLRTAILILVARAYDDSAGQNSAALAGGYDPVKMLTAPYRRRAI